MSQFQDDIKKFNAIYKLPVAAIPTLRAVKNVVTRLNAFKAILAEELEEIEDVISSIEFTGLYDPDLTPEDHFFSNDGNEIAPDVDQLAALTGLADLLGDIQVYCASEMAKFGLPLDETLSIIMQSNFSKLGEDGLPIYDERGKVMKGPNYWKPEPMLEEMIKGLIAK